MAVENEVLIFCFCQVPTIQEGCPSAGGFTVEIPAQVVLRVIGFMHNGVVDPRVWDGKPPHAIGIFRCQGC